MDETVTSCKQQYNLGKWKSLTQARNLMVHLNFFFHGNSMTEDEPKQMGMKGKQTLAQ